MVWENCIKNTRLALFKIPHCILVFIHIYLEGRNLCYFMHPCVTKVL